MATTPQPPERLGHPRRWVILALVLAAECMDLLDSTIVNVAAPSIRADLGASASGLQWIVSGYALAFSIGLVSGGRMGDSFGRRRLFIIGALGFVAASLACGLCQTQGELIACRLVQGSAAALLIPQGLGIIYSAFATSELSKAFTFFGPVMGLSAVLGPILGGVLVDANAFGTGWRLVFFINLPIGLAAAIGAVRLIPESTAPTRVKLDLVGTALIGLASFLLIYPLVQGREAGWPAWTFAMMAGAVVSLGVFALWSRYARRSGRDPLVEASIFAHRAFTAGTVCILGVFGSLMGALLTVTMFLQLGEHFSAVHAGLTLAPLALGSAVGAGLSGALLAPKLGRGVLQLGCLLMAIGAGLLNLVVHAHGLHTTSLALAGPLAVVGAGMGMLISTLFAFVLAAVTEAEVGSASGVTNAVQQLAGALGVATVGTLFFDTLDQHGFVSALSRCLVVLMVGALVVGALTLTLPRQARPELPGEDEISGRSPAPQALPV